MQDTLPKLDPDLSPPVICGPASLAHRAFADHGLDDLLAFIARPATDGAAAAALALDSAYAHQLRFRGRQAAALQVQALDRCQIYRIANTRAPVLRVLAVMAPGDLMVNTPLDFITAHLDVQLDLLFVLPGRPLPAAVPEHDVAFFAVSESDPATLLRLAPLFAAWPRPALNNPVAVLRMTRDGVAAGLRGLPGATAPLIALASRTELTARLQAGRDPLPGASYPLLARPRGSHAGHDLEFIADAAALGAFLGWAPGDAFFLSGFIDYRGPDGLFRKFRVVFIDGVPLLCHMAASEHWMVHYLNAGMAESEAKRGFEAAAMAEFDGGFAVRHRVALAALDRWMGLDYHQIDCAELPDGRLLVFEADVAAIIHMMDPPDLYPYKAPQMRRVIEAFGAMLRKRAAVRLAEAAG